MASLRSHGPEFPVSIGNELDSCTENDAAAVARITYAAHSVDTYVLLIYPDTMSTTTSLTELGLRRLISRAPDEIFRSL